MWWLGVPVLAVVLFFAQGFLLQVSVALSGEAAPKYGSALWTAILAGILASITTSALGFTVGWFVPTAVWGLIAFAIELGVTAIVIRGQIRSSFVQALGVAGIYQLLVVGASWAAWYVWRIVT
ncbi:MAG: hypothetical protein ABMB14_20615 [Myxococcota bacterium]